MAEQDYVTDLVRRALDDAANPSVPTSALAQKALRVARLRNDWNAILWLQLELRQAGDEEAKRATVRELAPHYTREEFDRAWKETTERYLVERGLGDDAEKIVGLSLGELEATASGLRQQVEHMQPPAGLHTLDLYHESRRLEGQRTELLMAAGQREQVLARVRARVVDFLSTAERQLAFGQINADVFERNRVYVDQRLARVAPQALEQFAAAYRRQAEGDAEARSHALTSCRRVLKTLADALYPASGEKVVGVDGRERKMTDDKFIARLCQYASESGVGSAARQVLAAQIAALGERLDALNDLASKGVHANVSPAEVDQCLIQTYLTVGDLLRLSDDDSGLLSAEAA